MVTDMPKFSIVFAATHPEQARSEWLCSQESDLVEVLIAQLEQDVDCASLLNQAIEAATGEYIALVDDSLVVSVPHWLELLQAHIESSPYQVLGLSGFEQLAQQDAVVEPAVRIVTKVANANGPGISAYSSSSRLFGDTHVKEVVIVDGRCMFARREIFQQFPLQEGMGYSLANTVFNYQVRLAIELGQAQGVLLGIPHRIADDSPWQDEAQLNRCWDGRYQHILPLDPMQLSIWRLNLKALDSFEPQAAQQLLYLLSRHEGCRFQVRDHNRISAIKDDQIALIVDHFNEVEALPNGDTFVLCGAGTGLLIQQLLDKQSNEVLVVEPEYGLICELLKYYDWSDALSQGRLRFLPLISGTHELDDITLTQTTRLLQIILDRNQRVTHVVRGYSYHLNAAWYRRIEQGLVQYLNQREATAAWVGKRRRVYDVTVVSPKCAIFANLAQCFNDLGLRTRLFNVPDKPDQLSVDRIRELLMQLAVDGSRLTLCRNRSFFETENVRKAASFERFIAGNLVNWWWDIPNVASFIDFNDPLNNAENIGFAVDMLNFLPKGSHWLPPAANVKFCRERDPSTPWLFGISFVGQSRIPLLNNNLQAIISFLRHQCGVLPAGMAEALLEARDFRTLYRALSALENEFLEMVDDLNAIAPAHVYYFRYIYQMSKTAAFRVAAIETLFAHNVSVAVFGDNAWVESGVVPKEHFHGLIAPDDLPKLYQASQVNLNLNFMQVSSTVNPKVFDILAAGGGVVTDFRPEIDVLFPDQGFGPVVFKELDGLLPAIEKALQNSQLRIWPQLGQVVRTKHTLLHRAKWFVDSYLS